MLRELKIFGLAVAAVIGLGAMSANAVVIDDFTGDEVGPLDTFNDANPSSDTGTDTVTISAVTFDRDVVLTQDTPVPSALAAASAGTNPADLFVYNNDDTVESNVVMTYTAQGGGFVDFSADNGIRINLATTDSNGVDFLISITESAGEGGSTATSSTAVSEPQILFFDFAAFTDIGDVSLTQISQIVVTMTVEGDDAGADISLNNIFTTTDIPEPASMALVGLGAVALVARRRRQA